MTAKSRWTGRAVTLLLAAVAAALLFWAWRAELTWFCRRWGLEARHAYFASIGRVLAALLAALLVAVARPLGRAASRTGARESLFTVLRYSVALGAALVAGELGARALHLPRTKDPAETAGVSLGERHPRYGWVFKASQVLVTRVGGRDVELALNAEHDRARSIDRAYDLGAETILFAGESITAGHGLAWDETYPALVGLALGAQVVDLGVDGYGSDQAFLRLADTLPRFERPSAVVTFFIPTMVDRLARIDHPRVEFDGLEVKVLPPDVGWRRLHLVQAFYGAFEYRDEGTIARAAEVVRETARLAKARGARPLFVAPFLGVGPRQDGYLVDVLFRQQGLPVIEPDIQYVRLPGDYHPNAESTRLLADAVVHALQAEEAFGAPLRVH
ncbi:MAG TPA: hypothetical protein VGI39_46135 [Polyangiaceae bacterium]